MTDLEFLEKLKVINDNTRLTIIKLLAQNGTMCACKILEELNITQGTLSHHMRVLKEAGIVTCKKDGKWCHYTLVRESISNLAGYLLDICSMKEIGNKCC